MTSSTAGSDAAHEAGLEGQCFLKHPSCSDQFGAVSHGGGVNACICGAGSGQVCTTTSACPNSREVGMLIPTGAGLTGGCYPGCSAGEGSLQNGRCHAGSRGRPREPGCCADIGDGR